MSKFKVGDVVTNDYKNSTYFYKIEKDLDDTWWGILVYEVSNNSIIISSCCTWRIRKSTTLALSFEQLIIATKLGIIWDTVV